MKKIILYGNKIALSIKDKDKEDEFKRSSTNKHEAKKYLESLNKNALNEPAEIFLYAHGGSLSLTDLEPSYLHLNIYENHPVALIQYQSLLIMSSLKS